MKNWISNFIYYLDQMVAPDKVNALFYKELNIQSAKNFEDEVGFNPLEASGFFKLGLYPPNLVPDQYNDFIDPQQIHCLIYASVCSFKIVLRWRSKSHKIYRPTSSDIDPSDIEFWFEGLNKSEVLKVWYNTSYRPKLALDVDLKYNFKLLVHFFNYEAFFIKVTVKCPENCVEYLKSISDDIDSIFESHNKKSIAKSRKFGIVHDFGMEKIFENTLLYYIDYGSANEKPLKQVIANFDKFENIESVEITSEKD